MYFFYLLAGAGLGFGLFFIFCDIFKVPQYKTSRTMISMEKHYETKESRINSGLEEVAKWICKWLRLRDHKQAQIQADLTTAHMTISPEMFVANCLVKAGVIACLGVPFIPIFPFISLIAVGAAVFRYVSLRQELTRKVRVHREAVEFELSQMIFAIEQVLAHNRNVIQMLQNYREIAGPELAEELDITLSDMLSGNHEEAISRMEIRVGSVMMSDVCRGLISVLRGDDTTAYWVNLQHKFTEHQRDILKQKVSKIPAKVNRLSMGLLFAFMALWLGAIILQMAGSLSGIFSLQ